VGKNYRLKRVWLSLKSWRSDSCNIQWLFKAFLQRKYQGEHELYDFDESDLSVSIFV